MVPEVEVPPVIPSTCQITAVLDVFWTVAVNVRVRLRRTEALVGEMVTLTGAGFVTVTLAEPDAVGEATLVAFTVTAPEGAVAGAV